MLAINLLTFLFPTLLLAQSDKPDAPGYDRWSEVCLHTLNGMMSGKGVTDQPGYDAFGGNCRGTRVVKERLKHVSRREEWIIYSCCRKENGEYEGVTKLALQNCLAFNDAGGGTLTWQKMMRLADACKDCKVVGKSQNGDIGAHLRCTCEAPKQAAKTYELPIHGNVWAEGDLEGKKLNRYPCSVLTGALECGWAWCVQNAYQHTHPPGHWHGTGSPDANDPQR
ncbi:hypothetical protein LY76DRAFT_510109 [Colletotrichum caudatum]|nr:hypothetical protein LY76DRAFT_510109 [Colletotrichum caudatum]